MVKKAIFENLKYGDKVCLFNLDGKIDVRTYIARCPEDSENKCFLANGDSFALSVTKNTIETCFYTFDEFNDVEEHSKKMTADYYRAWLRQNGFEDISD